MPGVSYAFAFLLGTLLECVMYGVFVPLFIAACYAQWEKSSKRGRVDRLIVFATAFFGFTVTASLVISLHLVVQEISHHSLGTAAPLAPTERVVWFLLLQSQVTVADVIIVYRMYYICGRDPSVCVIPSITIAAFFAAGCGVANQLQNHTTNLKAVSNWSAASFCLAIFNSLFLTASISFRLWRAHRVTTKSGIQVEDSIILRAVKVLIESAALWTTIAALNFIAFLAKSNLSYTFLVISSPAAGISFCLIIVRMGRILPEARDQVWNVSVHTPASRMCAPRSIFVSLPRFTVRRDVYVSGSKDLPMEAFEFREQGYINFSSDFPKVLGPSPTWEEGYADVFDERQLRTRPPVTRTVKRQPTL